MFQQKEWIFSAKKMVRNSKKNFNMRQKPVLRAIKYSL
jgi:hypothetical protein